MPNSPQGTVAPPRRLAAAAAAAAMVAAVVLPQAVALANPVCTGDTPRELCGGRVFAEPESSSTALTYAQTKEGLQALEDEFPDFVSYETFGSSANGHELLLVELTNSTSSVAYEDRKIVLVNQSIHGNEPGGREGGPRYLEDLLRGADPERTALLDRVRLVQTFINPDGWTAGDHDAVPDGDSPGVWNRGNGSSPGATDVGGTDLNRQAPWRGLIPEGRDPVSQPESKAFEELVRGYVTSGQDIQSASDIHGEVPETAAWIMLSSGQFDLAGAMTQLQHARDMAAKVDEAIGGDPLLQPGGALFGTTPSLVTASSEFLGGASGSGFQGDWLAQPEGGDATSVSTIELLSADALPVGGPGLNSTTARREILQLYRETVTAIMGSQLDQAVLEHVPSISGVGDVGYVDDLPTVTDPVRGVEVTAEVFLTDLEPFLADGSLTAVAPGAIGSGGLDGLATLVISTAGIADDSAALDAVRTFAEDGGTVVLTDAAAQLLPSLVDGVAAGDVTERLDPLGRVDLVADTSLTTGTRDGAFMLTETATTSREVTGSGTVPTWRVASGAFEDAGGTTMGTSGDGQTSLGEVPLGDGVVRTIGVLLPPPVPDETVDGYGRNLYGLNAHGVIDTGYQVFINALGGQLTVAQQASITAPSPPTTPVPVPSAGSGAPGEDGEDEADADLAATGSAAGSVGVLLLISALAVARSRRRPA